MSTPSPMNPDIPNEFQRRPKTASERFLILLALAVLVGALPWWLMRQLSREPFGPGRPLPEIVAAGWLNGEAPTRDSLHGKVVVLNVWASW